MNLTSMRQFATQLIGIFKFFFFFLLFLIHFFPNHCFSLMPFGNGKPSAKKLMRLTNKIIINSYSLSHKFPRHYTRTLLLLLMEPALLVMESIIIFGTMFVFLLFPLFFCLIQNKSLFRTTGWD